MIQSIIPRLPARDLDETLRYATTCLGFTVINRYPDYLLMHRDSREVHFFLHPGILPEKSDHMVYVRVSEDIERLYDELIGNGAVLAKGGKLSEKAWGQTEFAVLDPNGSLFVFGEAKRTDG